MLSHVSLYISIASESQAMNHAISNSTQKRQSVSTVVPLLRYLVAPVAEVVDNHDHIYTDVTHTAEQQNIERGYPVDRLTFIFVPDVDYEISSLPSPIATEYYPELHIPAALRAVRPDQ